MTLTEFLLARIAEDEESARFAMSRNDGGALDYAGQWFGAVGHAERWEPVRVLAECEAKRRIVERCRASNGYWGAEVERMLALPYADHPDYREEWKP
jgi:hypothetical protein